MKILTIVIAYLPALIIFRRQKKGVTATQNSFWCISFFNLRLLELSAMLEYNQMLEIPHISIKVQDILQRA